MNETLAIALGPTPECLPIDELVLRLLKPHVAGCFHCRAELALFKEFESSVIRADERRAIDAIVARFGKRRTSGIPRWWSYIWQSKAFAPAVMALATVLVAATIGLHRPPTPVPEITGSEVMRTLSVEVVAPLGDIKAVPTEFKWRAVSGARNYRVRVSEVDTTAVWTATVRGAQVSLPIELQRKIVPLKTLVLEITALNENGTAIARSGSQRFRLLP